MSYGSALISTKNSQLAGVVIGSKSLYAPRGSQALTPVHIDDTATLLPIDNNVTPTFAANSKVRFALPKTATIIGKAWVEITLSAGVSNPAFTPGRPFNGILQIAAVAAVGTPQVAYVKNAGDLIIAEKILKYGSNVLQQYSPEFDVIYRRLCHNDVNIEATNANVLGGLPPGGAGEQARIDAWYNGVTLRHPCDELFWTANRDEHWFPESLALEGELTCVLRAPGEVMYTSTGAQAVISTMPTITNVQLRYQEITLSAAEKENRLMLYKSPEGHVIKMLDLEAQSSFTFSGSGAAPVPPAVGADLQVTVPLSNFRMDMAEIIFLVRILTNSTAVFGGSVTAISPSLQDFQGDRLESDSTAISLVTGNSVATVYPVRQFKLQAAGKDIMQFQPDLWNRSAVRKAYHPDSQIADGFYTIPFAIFPEDRKNATGHQSASVLGQLQLILTIENPGSAFTFQVDAWSHSHNLIQARAGGIAKALH